MSARTRAGRRTEGVRLAVSTPSIDPLTASTYPGGAWAWTALLVAVAGATGSLFLSLGLGLQACPLCFYQRAFVLAVVGVLGVGLLAGADRVGLLALAPAAAGLGVAAYHVGLELGGRLECPPGVLGLGTAPQQSLALFALLVGLLALDALRGPAIRPDAWTCLAGAVGLGALLAVASCVANPPVRPPPPEVYARPPEVCRPPPAPGATP
jgi:disulfide bond formation protein DsbB